MNEPTRIRIEGSRGRKRRGRSAPAPRDSTFERSTESFREEAEVIHLYGLLNPDDPLGEIFEDAHKLGSKKITARYLSAKKIESPDSRAICLSFLARYVPSGLRKEVITEALSAIGQADKQNSKAWSLRLLNRVLLPEHGRTALALALGLTDLELRASSGSLLSRFIEEGWQRRYLLKTFTVFRDQPLKLLECLDELYSSSARGRGNLREIAEPLLNDVANEHKILNLIDLSPRLLADIRPDLFEQGLSELASRSDDDREFLLRKIARYLPRSLVHSAWKAAEGINDARQRRRVCQLIGRENKYAVELGLTDKLESVAPSGFEAEVSKETNRPPSETLERSELPDKPPRLWKARAPGRPPVKEDSDEHLVSFLREVYGRYLPKFRERLRAYIFSRDRALYRKVYRFEAKGGVLPPDLYMPSERVVADKRRVREAKQAAKRLEGREHLPRRPGKPAGTGARRRSTIAPPEK
jgi:hypothetical protein